NERNQDLYYQTLVEAFSKNPETSIPTFEEFVLARKAKEKAKEVSARLLLEKDKAIGIVRVHKGKIGEIHTIGLIPEYRGKGYGQVLMKEALRLLASQGVVKYKLNVAAANEKALSIYRAFGFEIRNTYSVYQKKLR